MSEPVLRPAAHRQWLPLAIGAAALSTAALLLLPAAVGRALDTALDRHGGLAGAVTDVALLLAVLALTDVAWQLAGAADSAGTTAWLRRQMTSNLLGYGPRRHPVAEVESRILTDAAHAGRLWPARLAAGSTAVCTVVALVALGLIDWPLPVVTVLGLPLAFRSAPADPKLPAEVAERFDAALAGLRDIRAAGSAAVEVDRVLAPLNRLRSAEYRWLPGALRAVLLLAVLAMAGWSLGRGRISGGDFVAAIGYATIALGRVGVFADLARTRAAAGRVTALATDVPVVPRDRPLPIEPGVVELRSVSVAAGDRLVLDRCTLSVPAGSTLAVVGPPGSGKSTLVGLLGRLVEPDSGEVLVEGCPVSTMDRAQLRQAVGYAFARPVLLGATVAEAIGYAATSQVQPAAVAADADRFIRRLPAGYRTALADAPLSADQRCRIGLARVVAQRPRIVVLDDAVAGAFVDRTRIVLARRAETAAAADRVAWLENGVIRAIGPHEQLLDEPDYKALWT